MPEKGTLQVQLFKENTYVPIENAKVTVIPKNETTTRQVEQTVSTDSSGLTQEIELNAPSIDNSMKPSDKLPYSFCDIRIQAKGYIDTVIKGCQIYPKTEAIQQANLKTTIPRNSRQEEEIIDVPQNTLVGDYPRKIPEDPDKILPPPPTGLVVLPKPVVPQYIVVHAGGPDSAAPNYTVRFKDYIKNVASCEIFSTWPETTIRANVFCILSFTLNRIYTEWYKGKGKNFDITNSTAYDHAFSYGRNIYRNISRIVDEIFSTYMKRANKKQPLLAQYCDGVKVRCPGWLTQWGSKYLGDAGKTPYAILTNFYGSDLSLVKAEKVEGIPRSYPGYTLGIGSGGTPVRTIQIYLNRISQAYPAIPKQIVDGIYGQSTRNAVLKFQSIFSLAKTGTVNYSTWYAISDVYVAVTGIAELRGEDVDEIEVEERVFMPPVMDRNIVIPQIKYPIDNI